MDNEDPPIYSPADTSPEVEIDKQEIFADLDHEPLYVASGEGRKGNIEHAFSDFIDRHRSILEGIKGNRVLVKVNAVDPSHPHACTSAEALRTTLAQLAQFEPAEICIGDQPAGQVLDSPDGTVSSPELFKRFETELGYDFLDDFPNARFIDFRSELQAPEPSPGEARIYDLSDFQSIIVLSLPKSHGQLDFSGCRKNIIGLLPQQERTALLHSGALSSWRSNNNAALSKVSEAYVTQNPNTIYIMDGFETLIGHEHTGIPRVTDYAIATRDPYNADVLAASVSFSPESAQAIEYLQNIPTPITPNTDKTTGIVPSSPEKLIGDHRAVCGAINPDGSMAIHETIIDPEVDETVVKPIKEILLSKSTTRLTNIDKVITTLAEVGSDPAIECLLILSERIRDVDKRLARIFYSAYIPIVSSRGLDPSISDKAPSQNLDHDKLYLRFSALQLRMERLGLV